MLRLRDIVRMLFAGGLALATIATVMAGPGDYIPDPNDPFYQGNLCLHGPSAERKAP